jgi:crossover junction endodeoxyribonuclease RuvC
MSELVIGCDPGSTGAFALVTVDGDLLDVLDAPILEDGTKGRKTLNGPLLASMLARWHAREMFCEFVGARPSDGAVQAFAFGKTVGVIQGVCAALSLPISFITPQVWKRTHSIPPGKDGAKDLARSKAIALWPAKADLFARKLDHNRAESALIALCGLKKAQGGAQ